MTREESFDSNVKQQMHGHVLAAGYARGLHIVLPPRGSRECRMRAAPAVSCANCTSKNAHEHTGQRRTSDIPCAMALRLITRSPRRIRALLSPLPYGIWHVSPVGLSAPPQDLTPTTGASGPHVFAVRFSIVRPARRCPLTENRPANTLHARRRRVHRIPSQRSVTMANAPPRGQDGVSRKGDLPDGLSEILPDGLLCRITSGWRRSGPETLPHSLNVIARSTCDEAIHSFFAWIDGLLRYARNDELYNPRYAFLTSGLPLISVAAPCISTRPVCRM